MGSVGKGDRDRLAIGEENADLSLEERAVKALEELTEALANGFVVFAKGELKRGGEASLGKYVAKWFQHFEKETQSVIVVRLIKSICEREH